MARENDSGLLLLDQAEAAVLASLQFRENFSLKAEQKYQKSLKKVSCQSDILYLTGVKYFSGFQETRRKSEDDL